jgi:predicted DNA binding CopG/RHH family protein
MGGNKMGEKKKIMDIEVEEVEEDEDDESDTDEDLDDTVDDEEVTSV